MKTALFIGRFQPLHNGHVHAIRRLQRRYRVVIGIGSINKKDAENPFSFSERKAMLRAVFPKTRIVGLPDNRSDKKWTENVCRHRFDVVVTGNGRVAKCLHAFPVISPAFLRPKKYNATRIRQLIAKGKEWRDFVPRQAAKIIEKHKRK